MAPFMGVSGFGGPGSALGKYTPDPRLNDTYWIASLEKQGGVQVGSGTGIQYSSTSNDGSEGNAIAVDNKDGSVYVVGSQIRMYNEYGSTRRTMYITKFDKAGTLQWQRLIGHRTDNDGAIGRAVGVDGQGNVYAIGDAWLGGSSGGMGGTAYSDIMITKYDSSGEIIFQRKTAGYGYDLAMNGLKVTAAGKLYIPNQTNSSGYYQRYTYPIMGYAVFDSDGVRQSRRYYIEGSEQYDVAGVEIDSSNNVYLVGYTKGHSNALGRYGGILVKLPPDGTNNDTPIWKYALYFRDSYGRQDVKLYSTAMDSLGNLYVAGTIIYSQGHAQSIPEEAFICQVRYDVPETRHDDGTHATPTGFWCKRFRYTGSTKLRSTFENGQMSIDSDGNLVAVGSVTVISTGERDYLIMKLDPSDGSEIWTRTLNNSQGSSGGSGTGVVEDSGQGLAIDNRDNIYICGKYARSSDKGTMIAKLPGDGSLYDFQKGTPSSLSKIIHGGRYRYSNNDGTGSNTYSYYYDDIGAVGVSSASYYRMHQSNEIGQVNSAYIGGSGQYDNSDITVPTGIGSMGHTVSVIHDITRPIGSYSYDYSFPDEVYYGDGTIGSGTTIPLGTQNYHYSGDGTMPAVGLGTVQNWDMFFELKRGKLDVDVTSSSNFVIGNSGYTQSDGFMLQFKSEFIASAGAQAISAMNAYNNGVELKSLMPVSSTNPITVEENRPMSDEWNWFKLEWRGGTSFKIWHKKTSTGNYANLFTSTDSSQITNQTNWDYISIGQAKGTPASGLTNQFYGRIKNFGLNVNSNVVDLSDNTNISTDELIVHMDASNPNSYSGIGSTCNNLARNIGITTDINNYDGLVHVNAAGIVGSNRRNAMSYSDIVLKTGSGLDGTGVTTSLSAFSTFNGVPVFTDLRGYSSIREHAFDENGTYVGMFQMKDLSYSIWYYPLSSDLNGSRNIMTIWESEGQYAGWNMGINYSNQLYVGTAYHGAETTNITLTANNWYNIVMVSSDSGTVDFYINGVKEHTGTATWPYNYTYDTISIGGVGIDSSNYHQINYYYNVSGPISSVAVYNKRLIQSEVESNYNRNCSKYGLPYLSAYNTSG